MTVLLGVAHGSRDPASQAVVEGCTWDGTAEIIAHLLQPYIARAQTGEILFEQALGELVAAPVSMRDTPKATASSRDSMLASTPLPSGVASQRVAS